MKNLEEIYSLLNKFLEKTKFIALDNPTIADFSVVTHITTLEIFVPINVERFPKLAEWKERVAGLPCYAVSVPGLKKSAAFFQSKNK